jgi:hypothetical protein
MGGMFTFWNSGGALGNNNYLVYGDQDTSEANTQIVITKDSVISNLTVRLTAAPGGTTSRTFTLRLNGANTALSVTITGAATTGSNTVDTVSVTQFDRIALLHTRSAPPFPNFSVGSVSVQIV